MRWGAWDLNIFVIDTLKELEKYRPAWEAILEQNHNDIPFLEFDWIRLWWEYLGGNRELFILAAQEDKEIVGFFPFMLLRKGWLKIISFIGFPQAYYMDFVLMPQYRDESIDSAVSYLMGKGKNYLVDLDQMHRASPNFMRIYEYVQEKGYPVYCCGTEDLYIDLTRFTDFDDYYYAVISSHIRKNIKRREKKLKELGDFYFRPLDLQRLEDVFSIHRKEWRKRDDRSGFSEGKTKEFFIRLLSSQTKGFQAHMDAIQIDDKVIAFRYGLSCRDKFLFYRVGYDLDFHQYSPGILIYKEKIKQCFENGYAMLELGPGDQHFKSQWTCGKSYVNRLILPTRGVVSYLFYYLYSIKDRMRLLMRRHRFFVYIYRNLPGRLRYCLSSEYMAKIMQKAKQAFYELVSRAMGKTDAYFILEGRTDAVPILNGDDEIRFRKARVSDLDNIARMMNQESSRIVNRWYKGDSCIVGERDQHLIHCTWLEWIAVEGGRTVRENNGSKKDMCMLQHVTDPAYSGENLDIRVLPFLFKMLQDKGVTRVRLCVEHSREKLIGMLSAVGFAKKYMIRDRRVPGKELQCIKAIEERDEGVHVSVPKNM